MKKAVVLTGMMGVGKSTIGKKLATELSFEFIDIDKLIEEKEGSSINFIFRKKSENYFRKLESEISLNQLKKNKCVIALGGGAFLNKNIRRVVKKKSISFWLDVNINELVKRLKKSRKRPLLSNKNLSETVSKIYFQRMKTYGQADFKIMCSYLQTDKIVRKMLRLYEKSRN